MLLSIAMIVKNEEKNLSRTLQAINSLKYKINYEIIIVDTGSVDNTINIAKQYTNKVYQKEWNGNFAQMRNYSINKCKGDWILILDADEILENPNELISFFKDKNINKYNSATLKFKNMFSNKEDDYLIGTLVRLFRNEKEFCYQGRVHEQPKIIQPTKLTNITLVHYGYSRQSYKLMKYKYERNLELLLEDLKENDSNPYTYFQLAQTYGMANMQDKAFESISKSYKLIREQDNKEKYLYIYHFISIYLNSIGEYEKAIELSKEALSYNKEHLDFYYIIAKAYSLLNKYDEAEYYYEEYFNLHKKIESGYLIKDISVNNHSFSKKKEMLKDRFTIAFRKKDYDFIIKNYKSYKEDDIEEILIYSFIKKQSYKSIFDYYENKEIKDKNINDIISICEKVNRESLEGNILDIYEKLLGLDDKLDFYINSIYKNVDLELKDLDLNNYYIFKAKLLTKDILENNKNLSLIKDLSKNDIYNYLSELYKDYRAIEILYTYSKENFLESDINNLEFLNIIEDLLIKSENIENGDYQNLLYRVLINKINYIRRIYSDEVLNNPYKRIFNKDEKFFISIMNLFNLYSSNKHEYIKELRNLLKEYPEYKVLINYLKDNIKIDNIDYNIMLNEKENLIYNIQVLIENNKVQEAEGILLEIYEAFRYDSKINNLRGIIKYLNQEYEQALIYMGLSKIFKDDDFDSTYNLALVLKELSRNKESIYYYKKALELCNDEAIKEDIIKNINIMKL
ncbi:glycosyltransferase [Clostridium tertium]